RAGAQPCPGPRRRDRARGGQGRRCRAQYVRAGRQGHLRRGEASGRGALRTMKRVLLAAAAALIAGPTDAQGSLPDVPLLAGATPAPDCGNLYGMAGKAFCVSAPLAAVGALADAYVADLEARGWLVAAGDANRVVFVKRR